MGCHAPEQDAEAGHAEDREQQGGAEEGQVLVEYLHLVGVHVEVEALPRFRGVHEKEILVLGLIAPGAFDRGQLVGAVPLPGELVQAGGQGLEIVGGLEPARRGWGGRGIGVTGIEEALELELEVADHHAVFREVGGTPHQAGEEQGEKEAEGTEGHHHPATQARGGVPSLAHRAVRSAPGSATR